MRATRRARRGFTLIELVLAAALGVFIVAAVFGLFALLRVSQERSAARAEALHQLASLQEVLAKSFRTMVVLESVRPPRVPAPRAGAARPEAAAEKVAAEVEEVAPAEAPGEARLPRLRLVQVPGEPAPRLEMVVASPPVAVTLADGTVAFIEPEMGGGVRGVFEPRRGKREGTFDLVYRVYDFFGGAGESAPVVGEREVCTGLTELLVTFFKTEPEEEDEAAEGERASRRRSAGNESLIELGPMRPGDGLPDDADLRAWSVWPASRTYAHLPAFVEVEAVTAQGLRGRWCFEVKFIVAREADPSSALASRGAGGGSGDGADNGTGSGGSGAGGGGSRGRGSRASRGPKGETNESTIQVFGPDGRPR